MQTTVFLLLCLTGLVAPLSQVIQCSPRLFCNRQALDYWKMTRDAVQQILRLQTSLLDHGLVRNSSQLQLLALRDRLCQDTSMTVFLLDYDEKIDEQELSCVWPGSETSITCTPVPEKYRNEPYTYISPQEARDKIARFRRKIGCRRETEEGMYFLDSQVTELHICNERCIQAGIGYVASCLMMIVFSVAVVLHCIHGE